MRTFSRPTLSAQLTTKSQCNQRLCPDLALYPLPQIQMKKGTEYVRETRQRTSLTSNTVEPSSLLLYCTYTPSLITTKTKLNETKRNETNPNPTLPQPNQLPESPQILRHYYRMSTLSRPESVSRENHLPVLLTVSSMQLRKRKSTRLPGVAHG